jgi:hypothetical protein
VDGEEGQQGRYRSCNVSQPHCGNLRSGANVPCSKYTSYGKTREGSTYPYAGVNQVGNAKKNLKNTVEQSLKRLRTSYLDILYVSGYIRTRSGHV